MQEGDSFDDHGSDSNRELPVTLQLGLLVDRQALESDAMAIRQIAEPVKCCKTLFLIHFNFFSLWPWSQHSAKGAHDVKLFRATAAIAIIV